MDFHFYLFWTWPISIYFHYLCAKFVYQFGSDLRTGKLKDISLPDLGFNMLQQRDQSLVWVPEFIFGSFLFFTLIPILWSAFPFKILCYYGGCHSLLLLLRCTSFCLTVLPDPTKEFKKPCHPLKGATFDLFFSGHVSMATIAFMTFLRFSLWPLISLVIFVPWLLILCLSIIAWRRHYSVDIWSGLYISILVCLL